MKRRFNLLISYMILLSLIVTCVNGRSNSVLAAEPNPVQGKVTLIRGGSETEYGSLGAALAVSLNGDMITVNEDLIESITYYGSAGKTITIDGQNHSITGIASGNSAASMVLGGSGTVIMKNITIKGPDMNPGISIGLQIVPGSTVNVLCDGNVTAIGGSSTNQNEGLVHAGSGVVEITEAIGGLAPTSTSYGVINFNSGTVNVNKAIGGINSNTSIGIYSVGTGTVNVNEAICNQASSMSNGISCTTGTVNVNKAITYSTTASAFNSAVHCSTFGKVNAGSVVGGLYNKYNSNVATIQLNKGDGANCVLDTITVAATGSTTIGILPNPYKDNAIGKWYTDNNKTLQFSGQTVSGGLELYSDFYTIPVLTISIGTFDGGKITASQSTAAPGDLINLSITPDPEKQLKAGSLKYSYGTQNVDITDTSFKMPAADVTVSGEFEDKTYTVSFVTNWTATIPDLKLPRGSKVGEPTLDTPGCRQDGWYTDSNFTTIWNFETDTIQQDMTLYLKYTPNDNVRFNSNGAGDIASQTVGIGEQIKEPTGLTNEGFVLEGWYLESDFSGEKYDFNTIVTTNDVNMMRILYAKWIPAPKPTTYTVTIGVVTGGGSIVANTASAAAGDTITLTLTPDPEKQLKAGSLNYNDGTQNVDIKDASFIMPAANVTISGEFEDKTYTVSFVTNWTATIPDLKLPLGSKVGMPTLDTPGCRQDGWYTNSSFTTIWNFDTDTLQHDMTLYLKYTPNNNVRFISNGAGDIASQTVGIGEQIKEPTGLTNEGFVLEGWYLESDFSGEKYDFNTASTINEVNIMRILYAKWIPAPKPTTYTVTIGPVTGGSIVANTASAAAGDTITLTITPNTEKQLKEGSLKYNDGTKDVVIIGTSFIMPPAPVTITAVFDLSPVPILTPTLISIDAPTQISGLPNGTAKTATALGLPSSVNIVATDTYGPADVIWDVDSCSYNPASTSVQTFTVTGTVELPFLVTNENNVSLNVTIQVTVNKSADSNIDHGGSGTGGNGTGGSSTGGNSTGGNSSGSNIVTVPSIAPVTNQPKIAGSETKGWDSISDSIKNNNTGNITIDMNGNTKVDKELFESIRGKEIEVTFILKNGVEWVINGTDIPKDSNNYKLTDMDLNLSLNTRNIPKKLLKEWKYTDTMQLSIPNNGDLGFSAKLRLPLKEKYKYLVANLFYYNAVTNQLELQSIGKISDNGYVELLINQGTDYIVVIKCAPILDKAIEQIKVTPLKKTLYLDGAKDNSVTLGIQIPGLIKDTIEKSICNITITYQSSNSNVATVSNTGKITAKKSGKTTITTTITINGVKKIYKTTITVKKAK